MGAPPSHKFTDINVQTLGRYMRFHSSWEIDWFEMTTVSSSSSDVFFSPTLIATSWPSDSETNWAREVVTAAVLKTRSYAVSWHHWFLLFASFLDLSTFLSITVINTACFMAIRLARRFPEIYTVDSLVFLHYNFKLNTKKTSVSDNSMTMTSSYP